MIEYSICSFRVGKINLEKENNMKIAKNTDTHYTLHFDIRATFLNFHLLSLTKWLKKFHSQI